MKVAYEEKKSCHKAWQGLDGNRSLGVRYGEALDGGRSLGAAGKWAWMSVGMVDCGATPASILYKCKKERKKSGDLLRSWAS